MNILLERLQYHHTFANKAVVSSDAPKIDISYNIAALLLLNCGGILRSCS